MILKLVFFDKQKYDETWLNRLFDRLSKVQNRQWEVKGGSPFGSDEIEFHFLMKDGSAIERQAKNLAQNFFNEIIWVFVLEQLNIDKFIVDGKDMTSQLIHR